MSKELEFTTYEEALEEAAMAKMEINEIFKPAATRQRKLWKTIFGEKDTSKFDFAKKLMFYQAGVPKEDSKAKIEGFRKQVIGMMEVMIGVGLEDNVTSYFKEAGVNISIDHDKYANFKNMNPKEKVSNLWDQEYFGQEMPYSGTEILKMLMDSAKNTESDMVEANRHIDEDIIEVGCTKFDIAPAAFKKAIDLMVAEKNGKDIQEKLQAIEDSRKGLDKALEPFTAGEY